MFEEMDMKEEENSIESNYFDNTYDKQSNNDLYLLSKENAKNRNEYFESEFKKVFNYKDTFGEVRKEEEKDLETERNDDFRISKKKIFKLIYNANKIINKTDNLKTKKIFTVFGKNNFKNYSFEQIIIYIKKLNNATKTSSSISYKYQLLKVEHKLILELKTRLLNKIKESESI